MSNWLIAKYSLALKKIYEGVRDKIPSKLQGSFLQNRKTILNYSLPLVRKSYKEGIDFATVFVKHRFNQDIETSYQINSKIKENLFKEFILLIRNAEDVFNLKMKQRERLLSVEKRKDNREGSDKDMIKWEYENAVKMAVNNLILNAGEQGQQAVFQKLKIIRES